MRGFQLQRLGIALEPEADFELRSDGSGGCEDLRITFVIASVVFSTGIDRRDDLGTPDRFGVDYGMADNRNGVARLIVPEHLPSGAPADGDGPKAGGQG